MLLRLSLRTTLAILAAAPAAAQLRIATWNISNYTGGRQAAIESAVYASFEGRSMAPDIIVGQEWTSSFSVTAFKNILNGAPGSPGDWDAAPFVNGPDTDSAFFFRTTRIDLLAVVTVATGGNSPNHPRNIMRYDVRLKNYAAESTRLSIYSSHMKAQESGTDDDARRLLEAQRIRDNAQTLDPAWHFILCGDFNIQDSASPEYQELVGSQSDNTGRFWDPINTPGQWNNNASFKIVHTQDPLGGGGMDDRFDQILVEQSLIDGDGLDYIGDPSIPYSTTTWNDPNHSYRAWGNDGTSFNQALKVAGNTMVGATIAQAIIDSSDGVSGHIPVFLDLRVPPRLSADTVINFGQAQLGAPSSATLTVSNSADVTLWNAAGIADLLYSMTASPGFSAPGGTFTESPGGAGNAHTLTMDTSSPGLKSGTLTIASNSPEEPAWIVQLVGEVLAPACQPCDTNCDGSINGFDVADFIAALSGNPNPCSPCNADTSGDGSLNGFDVAGFIDCLAP